MTKLNMGFSSDENNWSNNYNNNNHTFSTHKTKQIDDNTIDNNDYNTTYTSFEIIIVAANMPRLATKHTMTMAI